MFGTPEVAATTLDAAGRRTCDGVAATIVGGPRGSTIVGTPRRDIIVAGEGNDVIRAGGGDDLICGGKGRDRLRGAGGDDQLDGNRGGDYLDGGRGRDRLNGQEDGITNADGDGAGGYWGDRLDGGPGNDRLSAGPAENPGYLESGIVVPDRVSFRSATAGLRLTRDGVATARDVGRDQIVDGLGLILGTPYDDVIWGHRGAGVRAGAGDDRVVASQSRFRGELQSWGFRGGSGNDLVDLSRRTAEYAEIAGGAGRDRLIGGDRFENILGGGGPDVIETGNGRPYCCWWWYKPSVSGGSGDDRIAGGEGTDLLRGGEGADRIVGGARRDRISGNAGNDRLFGHPGDDRLVGGSGDDRADGGAGTDRCHAERRRACE